MSRVSGNRRCIAALLIGVLLVAGNTRTDAQINLPDIGDSSGAVLSAIDEKELGEAFMREIRGKLVIVEDPEIVEYIRALGYRLVSGSDEPDRSFTFFVVEDQAINAFAAPGGFVGVYSGLILKTNSESELAAVLAHEIAHVTQHHLARAVQLADRTSLPAMAGILAAIVLGAYNPQAGAATAAAVQAGAAQTQIDFTRSNEQEADRVGMQTLANSGFDPRAMPAFFEQLQLNYRYYGEPPEFLSTHPVTVSRIADSRNRAESYPYRQHADSSAFQLARAKLEVLLERNPAKAVTHFEAVLKTQKDKPQDGSLYGYGLAMQKAGRLEESAQVLTALLARDVQRSGVRDSLARVELARGRYAQALKLYEEGVALYPDDALLTLGYAEALLATGRARQAVRSIEEYQRVRALDARLYRVYARALENIGMSTDSKVAMAEHYYINGRLDLAIHQLRQASHFPGNDFYRNARIEARLKAFEEEQAQREKKR